MGSYGFEVSAAPVASVGVQVAAKKAVQAAAAKSNGKLRDLAKRTKDLMEASLGAGWHVAAGSDFSVDLRYRKGACVLLTCKQPKTKILLYRTTAGVSVKPQGPPNADAGGEVSVSPKMNVFDCDMDSDMQEMTISTAKMLLREHSKSEDVDAKLAQGLKQALTNAYGATWQVVVSKSRDLCVLPHFEPSTWLDCSLGSLRVVVYRHSGAELDAQVDMAQFGKRLALLCAAVSFVVYSFVSFTRTEKHKQCLLDANATVDVPEECSAEDIAEANMRANWKFAALVGGVVFTIAASFVRMYHRTLRAKLKQA